MILRSYKLPAEQPMKASKIDSPNNQITAVATFASHLLLLIVRACRLRNSSVSLEMFCTLPGGAGESSLVFSGLFFRAIARPRRLLFVVARYVAGLR